MTLDQSINYPAASGRGIVRGVAIFETVVSSREAAGERTGKYLQRVSKKATPLTAKFAVSCGELNPKELSPPPLALYIHIPWCIRKCPYCDFNSHAAGDVLPELAYVRALEKDLTGDLPWRQGRKLTSVFFGGGTPSLFSAAAIDRILEFAERHIGFEPGIEITLEANPGAAEQDRFADYRTAGVNRLSIGVQSFNDRHLKTLGRVHDAERARLALDRARAAGFDNINLDLMHGLPGQTPDDALDDLKTALELEPSHLSWYQLTIEPNTAFYHRPPHMPTEDVLADIQSAGKAFLVDSDFEQYEVSAWSRPGCAARHNLNYWQFGDYLGIGAGAHGKITDLEHRRIIRSRKTRLPQDYLDREDGHGAKVAAIPTIELPLEFLMNALRLTAGVPLDYFNERTGLPFGAIAGQWLSLVERGLVYPAGNRLRATPAGQNFLNDVLEIFAD